MNGKQLKNSILQWAIQGKLVPQDPNDEPASVLLEKIRTEKARLVKEGKIKKDKNESFIFRGDDNSYYEKFLATREVKCIDEEIPFEIPNGWEWARLNSYSDVRDGTHDTPQYVACGYPLITSKDFIGGIFDLSKTKYIDEQTFIEINKRSNVQIGDILFSMIGGNIGSMILITRENYFDMAIKNVALFKQYIYNDVLIKYLYFYLQSQVVSIKNTALGGAQSFVSLNMLRNYLMPIPPLNEQKKIIEKFKLLDFVIQQYEKSYCELNNLKHELFPKLKKSILQEAIQGKLVPQIEEEGTAQELLEQIKTEKEKLVKEGKLKKSALTDSIIYKGDDNKYYEQVGKNINEITEEIAFDLPKGWKWCRLKDICSIFTGATFKKEEATITKQGIRILRGGNISPFELKIKDDDIFLAKDKIKEAILLKENDILTPAVTSLENIGKMARVDSDMPDTTVGGFVFIIRLHLINQWFSKYILCLLSSPFMIDFMRSITNKSGQAFYNIGKERLSTALLPIPPLVEQHRIVAQIEKLFEQLR